MRDLFRGRHAPDRGSDDGSIGMRDVGRGVDAPVRVMRDVRLGIDDLSRGIDDVLRGTGAAGQGNRYSDRRESADRSFQY